MAETSPPPPPSSTSKETPSNVASSGLKDATTERTGKRIHFGSLEEIERENRKKPVVEVNQSNMIDLDKIENDLQYKYGTDTREGLDHQMILEEFERSKKARGLSVPTDDAKVKARLRELGHPVCIFGEGPGDRRDRLRLIMSTIEGVDLFTQGQLDSSSSDDKEEEFFTIGSQSLKEARQAIGRYSLPRAHSRLKAQTKDLERPIAHGKALRQDLFKYLKTYGNYSSQVGDERPLTLCRFSPDSKLLATGSWSGSCKIWSVPSCTPLLTLRGHTDRIGGIAFHPQATVGQERSGLNLASGGADFKVNLWSLDSETPLASLEGHVGRVSRVAFHPSGQYLGSASYDTTWRLWDVETTEELLLQEGHAREVYTIGFQPDGSLAGTGGLDAIGRVWDLRSGRSIMELRGHVKEILGLDFSPNGHELATSSQDNSIRIWDMRTLRSIYTIPAHKATVSDVRYYCGPNLISRQHVDPDTKAQSTITIPVTGLYLASSSYDGFIKLWSADDYRLVHALSAHEGRVMSCDISKDNRMLVTSGYDRTFKLWASDEVVF